MNIAYKKILTVIGMTGLLLSGCSNKEDSQTTPVANISTEQPAEAKALSDIYAEIEEKVELPKMVTLNDNYIANYFGIDLEGLEEYVFTNAEEVIYADTVILMKAKTETDKEALKEALTTMIDHKKAELENYLPEQFQIVEKSVVQTAGDYVYLVISEQAKDIETIIEQYVK